MRTALAAIAVLALACNSGQGDTSTIVPKPVEAGAGFAESPPAKSTPAPAPVRATGVPHIGVIDTVALASDGSAALTRDSFGGVRFWASLDGTSEPQIVPVPGARALSLAPHADGWTIALIDSAQAGRVLRASSTGELTEIASLAPFDPLVSFDALADGTHVLGLGSDASIRLYDDAGTELTRLQKRSFRPQRLFVSADGKSAVAMTMSRDTTGKTEGTLTRISIDLGAKPKLATVGDEISFATLLDTNTPMMGLSPDGQRFAYFNRNATGQTTEWFIVLVDLATGNDKNVASPIAVHLDPNLGFIDNETLMAYSARGATAWMIALDQEDHVTTRPAPVNQSGSPSAHDYSSTAFAAGNSQWLYVQDLKSRKERYLGYDFLQPNSTALSPSGEVVAWVSTTNQIFVEKLATGTMVEITEDWARNLGVQRILFTDEQHIIALDRLGGIRMMDWAKRETIAEAGASGGARDIEFLPDLGLLRITRNQNDSWIYELKNDDLEGPYIVSDAGWRGGLMAPRNAGDPVLWTLDSQGVYRSYTLEEIKADRTQKDNRDKEAKSANSGGVQPTAIDHNGVRYFLGASGGGQSGIRMIENGVEREIKLNRQNSSLVIPSPDGSRVLVTFFDGAVLEYDTKTLELMWSFSTSVAATQIDWSADGKRIAIAAQNGGAVLDADTGSMLRSRCAQAFEVRGTPPNQFLTSSVSPSLCER